VSDPPYGITLQFLRLNKDLCLSPDEHFSRISWRSKGLSEDLPFVYSRNFSRLCFHPVLPPGLLAKPQKTHDIFIEWRRTAENLSR